MNFYLTGGGIARIEGFVVFVPDANIGEKVVVKITKVMGRFAFLPKGLRNINL